MMKTKLPLFSAYGIELEYMIVDRNDLSVKPISDQLIHDVAGQYLNEVEFGHIAWTNELVLHVIELKTNGPAKKLFPLSEYFQAEINKINELLLPYNAKLLPTGAHPWMNPDQDSKLWPHEYNAIYETYHKIFNCSGHGWSNLQSVHLNLPFANDEEFAKLHTAIRLVLPIIPALSASTPIIEGKATGLLDTRLEYYRLNQKRIPSITGMVIPEVVFSEAEYNKIILNKMYQEISSYDPDKVLQEEWLNSRGAIARFERNTIEIRIIDTQECPKADLAIITLVVLVLKALVAEKWLSFEQQTNWSTEHLQIMFLDTIKSGLDTKIENREYLKVFGVNNNCHTVRDLWQHILEGMEFELVKENPIEFEVLKLILMHGNLAERIVVSLNNDLTLQKQQQVYQKLAACLENGELFIPS